MMKSMVIIMNVIFIGFGYNSGETKAFIYLETKDIHLFFFMMNWMCQLI